MKRIPASALAFAAAVLLLPVAARANSFNTFGDASVVSAPPGGSGNVYQLTSNINGAGYAGIYELFTGPVTLSQITTLSANFEMVAGTIGGGAPRFSIGDNSSNTFNEAYVFFGTPAGGGSFTDPAPGTYESTGNEVTSSALNVQVNGFGGDSTGATYETFAQFLAKDGNVDLGYITVDEDGYFSQPNNVQTVDIGNFNINGTVFNPPATTAAVPEPGSFVLLGTGILGAVGSIRRRR